MATSIQCATTTSFEMAFHPTITVYNTLTKQKEPFTTVQPNKVGIYLCGPTVYDKAHIGHMVGPVIFDCIKRYLEYSGYDVTWVVNITDVDDKLINKASERGISMLDVAEENIADYHQNLAALGVDQVDHFPRATQCMDEIVALIELLVGKDFAYEADGDVYFEVTKDSDYGKLSNRNVESTQGDGGSGSSRKRHAADFALWKQAKPGEPSWDSPWGAGRPGWHIECSAMSKKLLGETFDIHGGGLDLVFPHHENEIAQSECCHGKPMVRYWTHNGLLRQAAATGKIGGRTERETTPAAANDDDVVSGKMSRSKGAGGLADLIARQGGERIRFFLLRTHYRSTVLFNEPAIEEAGAGAETFYRLFKRYRRITGCDFYALEVPTSRETAALAGSDQPALQAAAECREKFLAAMDDDFNTGGAIAELFELAKLINKYCDDAQLEGEHQPDEQAIDNFTSLVTTLKELAALLGLFQTPPTTANSADDQLLGHVMQLVIDLRSSARESKNFDTADKLRDGVAAAGVELEDRPSGTEWSGGNDDALDQLLQLLIQVRADAREAKDFTTADAVRNRLGDIGVMLEDRAGGTEWSTS